MHSTAHGKVLTSYVGTLEPLHTLHLQRVPYITGVDPDLVLKLTPTGVTFLHERKFRKRYTGSTACAVDINGGLWLNARELDREVKKSVKDKDKKKRASQHGHPLKLLLEIHSEDIAISEPGAISQNLTIQQNLPPQSEDFGVEIIKKARKKAYTIDKAKVRQRILAMINTQKGKKHLYFWTVTFPAHTPDDMCYKAFNTWLTSLRQRGMLKDYLWVAERQTGERLKGDKEATNTVHFHIAIPHFMNVQRANAMMKGTLKNLSRRGLIPGAVCSAKSGEVYLLPSIARYNGVDICKHKKTKRVVNFAIKKGAATLATYLTKYVTKNDSEFSHLAWHNSRGFSCLFTGITCTLTEFKRMGFGGYLNRVRVFKMNFATFVPWLYGPPQAVMEHLYNLNSTIQTLFDGQATAN